MLSKNKIKHISSLQKKKFRDKYQQFIVEGTKLTDELIHSDFPIVSIIANSHWLAANRNNLPDCEIIETTDNELKKISSLSTPQNVLAIARKKESSIALQDYSKGLHIALDSVQDPGNIGTIIRIADWFGIDSILCSPGCADVFNPKVVQATMGALFRLPIVVEEIIPTLSAYQNNSFNIYGTFLEGKNIYTEPLSDSGIIIMGNEGQGICNDVKNIVTNKLYIPSFNNSPDHSESLNVAIATSITCSEFRRRTL